MDPYKIYIKLAVPLLWLQLLQYPNRMDKIVNLEDWPQPVEEQDSASELSTVNLSEWIALAWVILAFVGGLVVDVLAVSVLVHGIVNYISTLFSGAH